MSTIALKQLCALAYHYVSMNTIDTLVSQQRFTFVSWVVILVVMSTSIALIFFFIGQFTEFKVEELNADRLMTVAAEQKAWRTDEEMELTVKEKVIAFAKRALCAVWAYVKQKLSRGGGGAQDEEGDGGGGEGDVVVHVQGGSDGVKEAVVAFTSESVAKHGRELREIDEEIKGLVKDAKAAEARREAMLAKHNEIIALRLMEGEEIDGDGTLVLAREPLTIFGLAEAKLCPRCCRGKRTSHLHFPTGVLTRGLPPEVVVPNAAAGGLSAVPLHERARGMKMNPTYGIASGIAMQALSHAVRPTSASTMSGDGSGGSGAAARSGGDVRSAAAKVNAPPRDDSVAGEGGGGGGDALGAARFVSLAIVADEDGGSGGAAAHSGGEQSDVVGGAARFVSLALGSDGGGAAAAHGGGEQSDTMHFNRMAFDHLSAGAGGGGGGGGGIDSREEGGDAARSRDGLPDDDGAADRSGEEEEVPTWI
jgi:hypothetical protein